MVRPMPSPWSPKRAVSNIEVKVAGVTIDALGRRWDPSKHPRDTRGRFIETGGIARVWGGGLGRVTRTLLGGKVEVQMADGGRQVVAPGRLTMVRRPNGEAPTLSVKK